MKITQALIAVGGRAERLRNGGVDVPISKSFLEVSGKPLLFWNLLALHRAGITRIVYAIDDFRSQYRPVKAVLADLPVRFREAIPFCDDGVGVHGLPHQALDLLDSNFIFECGHSVMPPGHYASLMREKRRGNVVFSAFTPHDRNRRQPVALARRGRVSLDPHGKSTPGALAHPFAIDRRYARRLPDLGFNIDNILAHYCRSKRLRYVTSVMPPEFDVVEEFLGTTGLYRHYLPSKPALVGALG